MSHSSSSHIAHTVSESRYTASLSRKPTLDSEEDPKEHEVSLGRSASIPSPTPALTSIPSLMTRRGPLFKQTTRMRVLIPVRVSLGPPTHETLDQEMGPHPSLPARGEHNLVDRLH
ncbi:hypothetical protein Tco_1188312 [Tanacetum coccineum]